MICLVEIHFLRKFNPQKLYQIPKSNFKSILILFFTLCISLGSNLIAQTTRKVLFLGNSYTGVNNLPQMIHDVALSAGDSLIFDSNTPGGYQLIDHIGDLSSQNKIMAGSWDYVVLQGQSQEPITRPGDFGSGASALYDLIKQYNPCAVTMPYMTWGRKNGDASNCTSFPIMCTYQGMDTTLRDRYLNLTLSLNGEVSPVSVVWNFIRQNFPGIELYQSDESHPSIAGSYAAAVCFYTTIFKKDPTFVSFNSSLSIIDATIIKDVVKTRVFDSLSSWDFKKLPVADFYYKIGPGINEVIFYALNHDVRQNYMWDFGDGDLSSLQNPTHSYATDGSYSVELTASNCDLHGSHSNSSDTVIQFCTHTPTVGTSHSGLCVFDTLWTQAADSYQWFSYQQSLPETNQFLPDYNQYNGSGFSVLSTVNGCSELSSEYNESVLWSGYYFDVSQGTNPCYGDTVAFWVLNASGFLSGSELIYWYRNDTLILLSSNEDSLFITLPGNYQCKVIDPNSVCPFDTTVSSLLEYTCGVVSIQEIFDDQEWSLYPNPASQYVTVEFGNGVDDEKIRIYNVYGKLMREVSAMEKTTIKIDDLSKGIYFIRVDHDYHRSLKFIKY